MTPQDFAEMPVADLQRLTYELQLHQLELEMQNDEMHHTQFELQAARNRYADLYDFAPVGYLSLDADGVILETNLTATQMFGVTRSRLRRRRLSDFVMPEAQDTLYFHRQQVFAENTPCTCDLWMQRQDGTLFYAQLKSLARQEAAEAPWQWRLALVDLTALRLQAEERLAWTAAIVESSNDVIIGTNPDGTIVSWNDAATRLYGYTAAEMIGRSIARLAPPDYSAGPLRLLALLQQNEPIEHYEAQRLTKDGRCITVSLTYSPIRDRHGGIVGVSMIARDITARKQREVQLRATEKALRQSHAQLQRLARHQQHLQEQERAAIAREIHDEVAQTLTTLQLDIAWLAERLTTDPTAHDSLQAMASQVAALDRSMHRIAMELRPGLLDDLGLLAAMEWQLEETQRRTGLPYTFQVPAQEILLNADRRTALFRIFQEAVTNVVRHAHASHLTVHIVQDPEAVSLTVSDNGTGMTPAQLNDRAALGLLGMRERAQLWGGSVTIFTGQPGIGATVTVRMPYQAAAIQDAAS
jgi:PAS domain S-box-containing protein